MNNNTGQGTYMHNTNFKIIRNNVILSVILTFLFIVTGVMGHFINLISAILAGDAELAAIYGLATPGFMVGFSAALLGIAISLAPIWIPMIIAYFMIQNRKAK